MRKSGMLIPAFLLILLLATLGAYWKGRRDVWIAEFKTYDGNLIGLTHFKTNHSLELKEFLKSRYYYLANKIPKSWLGRPYDYGPVNTNVADLVVGKGPTTADEEYRKFNERGVPLETAK